MIIRYKKPDGSPAEYKLQEKQITLGRSPDADIIVLDERSSRMHCGVRLWEGDYYVKDLQSKNGTWVNGQRVEMQKLENGDRIRLGTTEYVVEDENAPALPEKVGTDTVHTNLQKEMSDGKGYNTILREIVEDTPKPGAAAAAAGTVASDGIKAVKKEAAKATDGIVEISDDVQDAAKNVTMPISLTPKDVKPKPAAPAGEKPKLKLKSVKPPTQIRLKKPPSAD